MTPKMSTYLVAFIVGDYDSKQQTTDSNPPIPVTLYAPIGETDLGIFCFVLFFCFVFTHMF